MADPEVLIRQLQGRLLALEAKVPWGHADFGEQNIVLSAQTQLAVTVSHGLGVVPTAVLATANGSDVRADAQLFTDTTFSLRVTSATGAPLTATYPVYWAAFAQ